MPILQCSSADAFKTMGKSAYFTMKFNRCITLINTTVPPKYSIGNDRSLFPQWSPLGISWQIILANLDSNNRCCPLYRNLWHKVVLTTKPNYTHWNIYIYIYIYIGRMLLCNRDALETIQQNGLNFERCNRQEYNWPVLQRALRQPM